MQIPNGFSKLDVKTKVSLAPLTTFRIGGPADLFYEPTTADQLANAVIAARTAKIPYFILGTGANILVSDKGFRGLVIHNRARHISLSSTQAIAESGATMAQLIELSARSGLSGLEHFAGIPSTVGGAIWQNLHFLSPDRKRTVFIAEVVASAQVLLANNEQKTVDADFFQFGYDDSRLHHEEIVVLSVTFDLKSAESAAIQAQIKANLAWRAERQPALETHPSAGSVFKKIAGVGAGRLIDQVGLKGKKIGGAQISEKHANFIVNTGQAKAADVLKLVDLAKTKVKDETGYELEMEIGQIGDF